MQKHCLRIKKKKINLQLNKKPKMKRAYFYLFFLLCAAAMSAQVRVVNIANPQMPSRTISVEVYDYDYVDVQPQFPGGERGLTNFINKTREYPYVAYNKRIEGRVLCSFIIGPDGVVSNVSLLRGCADETLNREALRVVKAMPKWKCGRMGKTPVYVRCILPIAFRL